MAAIVDLVMQRFFSPATLARGDAYAQSVRSVILGTDPIGYTGCCAALRDMDHTPLLAQIRVPTLLIIFLRYFQRGLMLIGEQNDKPAGLVWSTGDRTGKGFHADFQNGWFTFAVASLLSGSDM